MTWVCLFESQGPITPILTQSAHILTQSAPSSSWQAYSWTIHHTQYHYPPTRQGDPYSSNTQRIINKVCASWKLGIEKLMWTSNLVTTHTPHQQRVRSGKHTRKSKQTLRHAPDDENITYLETFNNINSVLARHDLLCITQKQSTPTIVTINHPHTALLNSIVTIVLDRHTKHSNRS